MILWKINISCWWYVLWSLKLLILNTDLQLTVPVSSNFFPIIVNILLWVLLVFYSVTHMWCVYLNLSKGWEGIMLCSHSNFLILYHPYCHSRNYFHKHCHFSLKFHSSTILWPNMHTVSLLRTLKNTSQYFQKKLNRFNHNANVYHDHI
jgi:hypothetical protein